jgi:hypothetical protein
MMLYVEPERRARSTPYAASEMTTRIPKPARVHAPVGRSHLSRGPARSDVVMAGRIITIDGSPAPYGTVPLVLALILVISSCVRRPPYTRSTGPRRVRAGQERSRPITSIMTVSAVARGREVGRVDSVPVVVPVVARMGMRMRVSLVHSYRCGCGC